MRKLTVGFTLIEISIVLVIIGLIVGGVLMGQELIWQSKIRSLLTEKEKISSSVNAFNTKYGCLPGDCVNATTYFIGVTNGDGNAAVNPINSDPTMGNPTEMYMFWKELYLAGLFSFSGTGVAAANPLVQVGVNIPESKFTQAGYNVGSTNSSPNWGATNDHFLLVGKNNANALNYPAHKPFLTATQAMQIDTKFDDGQPYSGTISGACGYGGCPTYPCINGSSPLYSYNSNATATNCTLIFYKAF